MKSFFSVFAIILLSSCRKDAERIDQTFYHVIVVAGQSNTHYGLGYDSSIDGPDTRILQFGRHDIRDYKIVQAVQPLDHHTRVLNAIGFAMTFAKLYLNSYVPNEEKILIIPCGKAGSSFIKNNWRIGGNLYNDLIERVTYVQSVYPNSELKAILWHQGESDSENNHYQEELDKFIEEVRKRLGNEKLPFILGGMVPYWVANDSATQIIQNILENTPERHSYVGYANPYTPFTIEKDSNSVNQLHYDAKGLRELGKRYYSIYQTIQ
ncbi:MAG: sialate O-acetylesterase [Crocinitomicaceae bacterium]